MTTINSLDTRRPLVKDDALEVLIGPNHKLVWAGSVTHGGVEVQLQTLDNELVAVIASCGGPISTETVQLAMPYVREALQYTINEDPI